MPICARSKGQRGEREFSHFLTDTYQIPASRGVQYQGSPDSPDIKTDLPIHFEVKRVNTLNVHKALEQAKNDSKGGKCPVVASRRDRGEWILHFEAKDLRKFIEAFKGVFCESKDRDLADREVNTLLKEPA